MEHWLSLDLLERLGPRKIRSFRSRGHEGSWRLSREIKDTSLGSRMAIISSTHGSGIPEEWRDSDFWKEWGAVYLGHNNDAAGERMAQRIREHAFRESPAPRGSPREE